MDKSEVRAVAMPAVEPLRRALGISEWVIHMHFDTLKEGKAECRPENGYSEATITIDPESARSKADVLDSLLHEMLHILPSEYELYRKAVRPLIGQDDNVWASLEEVYKHAAEATVKRIGDMLHVLNLTPARLVRKGLAMANS